MLECRPAGGKAVMSVEGLVGGGKVGMPAWGGDEEGMRLVLGWNLLYSMKPQNQPSFQAG